MTVNPDALPEADEADALEQSRPALAEEEESPTPTVGSTEANEADLIDQAQEVSDTDDEDYPSPDEQ
jgi:hypothetical protein